MEPVLPKIHAMRLRQVEKAFDHPDYFGWLDITSKDKLVSLLLPPLWPNTSNFPLFISY